MGKDYTKNAFENVRFRVQGPLGLGSRVNYPFNTLLKSNVVSINIVQWIWANKT